MVGHECDAPVTVRVDDVGIPVIDDGVTVHERKDGPLAMSRRAEVTFPLTGGGTEWYEFVDAFQDQGAMQGATVSMQPLDLQGNPIADGEELVIRGYIGAIGSRTGVNRGRFSILGPYSLLSEVPAGATFGADTPIREVLRWAMDRFEESQPIFNDVRIEGEPLSELLVQDPSLPGSEGRVPRTAVHSWTAARDTVTDVLDYVRDRADVRMWFEPDPDGGIILNVARGLGQHYDATDDDGDIYTIYNDALYELRPFNALTLKGTSNHTLDLGDFGRIDTPIGSGNYVEATAEYEPLVERAGGQIKQEGESRFGSQKAVEAHARRQLKQMLDDISGGTMDVALAPQVSPYDTIDALPACAGTLDADVPVLTYEVERTAHTLSPDPEEEPEIPSTEVAVSIAVDPEQITSTSTKKRAQPAEGTDNKPYDQDPASGFTWGFFD